MQQVKDAFLVVDATIVVATSEKMLIMKSFVACCCKLLPPEFIKIIIKCMTLNIWTEKIRKNLKTQKSRVKKYTQNGKLT